MTQHVIHSIKNQRLSKIIQKTGERQLIYLVIISLSIGHEVLHIGCLCLHESIVLVLVQAVSFVAFLIVIVADYIACGD